MASPSAALVPFIGTPPPGALVHPVAGPPRTDGYVLVSLTPEGEVALSQLCHTEEQRRAFALPSHPFVVRVGRIRPEQLLTHRPSYVNGLLIASRGTMIPTGGCMRSRGTFGIPTVLFGFWRGCCAGCKWKDQSTHCAFVSSLPPRSYNLTFQVNRAPIPNERLIMGTAGSPILIGSSDDTQAPIVISSDEESAGEEEEDEVEEIPAPSSTALVESPRRDFWEERRRVWGNTPWIHPR